MLTLGLVSGSMQVDELTSVKSTINLASVTEIVLQFSFCIVTSSSYMHHHRPYRQQVCFFIHLIHYYLLSCINLILLSKTVKRVMIGFRKRDSKFHPVRHRCGNNDVIAKYYLCSVLPPPCCRYKLRNVNLIK